MGLLDIFSDVATEMILQGHKNLEKNAKKFANDPSFSQSERERYKKMEEQLRNNSKSLSDNLNTLNTLAHDISASAERNRKKENIANNNKEKEQIIYDSSPDILDTLRAEFAKNYMSVDILKINKRIYSDLAAIANTTCRVIKKEEFISYDERWISKGVISHLNHNEADLKELGLVKYIKENKVILIERAMNKHKGGILYTIERHIGKKANVVSKYFTDNIDRISVEILPIKLEPYEASIISKLEKEMIDHYNPELLLR
ncbi:hypothetical protein [Butyrivibrio sp. AD3002]|uniref:hypothetical protein n=1 Tax=Butyrivibrio sp. AD3002 TaxID=1280670 RepID=UPI0003B49A05|nr:hypothetical protein [Butyrivibrio sp. AD3002]